MVSDVSRTGSAYAELLVVEDVVAVALRAHIAPKAVGTGRVLAIQQRVAVLHFQKAGVWTGLKLHGVSWSERGS